MHIHIESNPDDSTSDCQDSTNTDGVISTRSQRNLMESQIDNLYNRLLDSPESIDINATANPSAARKAVDAAQRYRRWKKSGMRANVIALVLVFLLLILLFFRLSNLQIIEKFPWKPISFLFLALAFFCVLFSMVSTFIAITSRRIMVDAIDNIEASSRLIDVESMNTRGVIDLMLNSITRIDRYYDWNISEARNIFWTAIGFSVVGFILFSVAVYTAIIRGDVNATIPAAVGGAIAELLAHTVLNMYRTSVEQLNHYHRALHEDQRFLANVGVVERLSTDDRRDALYRDIIHAEMRTTLVENNAQVATDVSTKENTENT